MKKVKKSFIISKNTFKQLKRKFKNLFIYCQKLFKIKNNYKKTDMTMIIEFNLSGLPDINEFEFDKNFYSILDLKEVNKIQDGSSEMGDFILGIEKNFKYNLIDDYKDVVRFGLGMVPKEDDFLDVVYVGLKDLNKELIENNPELYDEILGFKGKYYMNISLFVDLLYESFLLDENFEEFRKIAFAEILESNLLKIEESKMIEKLFTIFENFNVGKDESI